MGLLSEKLALKLAFHALALAVFVLVNVISYRLGWAKYNAEKMSWFDVVDYTVVTWTTVGFGNVYPTNAFAKVVSWAQMTAFLALVMA